MKCNYCGTENEYIRVLLLSLECTNTRCQNYSPLAAQEKANGVPTETKKAPDDEDWGDIFLDFPNFIP